MTFLFYALLFLGVVAIASGLREARRSSSRNVWLGLRVYLVVVAIYATFLLATTLAIPVQVLPLNETQYSGNWSITVASLRRFPHDLDENFELDFRLGNRGSVPIHGDSNLVAYLLGEDGTRYNPVPDPSMPGFDAVIPPGKYVITTRKYVLPSNLNRIQLVVAHQGFRLSWFVIGRTPLDGHTALTVQ